MPFTLFISFFSALALLGTWYLAKKLLIPFRHKTVGKKIVSLILVIFLLLPITNFLLRKTNYYINSMNKWTFFSLGFFSILLFLHLFFDVTNLFLKYKKIVSSKMIKNKKNLEDSLQPQLLERREFFKKAFHGGALVGSGLMSIKGYQLAFHTPEVRPVEIFLSKLPKAFDGFRILQISDLHVGPMIQKDYVEKVVEISSKHTVDLIALTGDFVDGSVESLREHVAPLEKLSAPMGKYFITGNHEYYSGVTQWIDEFKKLGAKVLLNEHVILEKDGEKIVLGGVTDLRGKMFNPSHISDPVKTFNNAPSNLLKILLAHQPKSIYAASEAGTDLQLSGHTHGGQYLPFSFLIYLFQPYVEGLNLHNKKTWIYVNQGTGFWGPPNRLGRKSEISLITLRTKA